VKTRIRAHRQYMDTTWVDSFSIFCVLLPSFNCCPSSLQVCRPLCWWKCLASSAHGQ